MDNMEYLCLYKDRWFWSYILMSMILITIMNILRVSSNMQTNLSSIFLLLHIYIVVFYKNDECAVYEQNKQKSN